MKKFQFNINHDMYIQITDDGWKHLSKTLSDDYINFNILSRKTIIDGEVWYKIQCYTAFELMPVIMGTPLLFNTNVLFDEDLMK